MKFLILLAAALALAEAHGDWSSIGHMHIHRKGQRIPGDNSRIVGGEEAEAHSLPYQAALLIDIGDRTAFCGGSLISPNYVMTAAHCVQLAKSIEVVLGAHKIQEEESTQVRMVSTEFFTHGRWSPVNLNNDIALVKLPQPVELNENIQLTKLPKRSDVGNMFDKAPVVASGWGKDSDEATAVSPVLRRVNVPVLGQNICNFLYFGVIQDFHICTSSLGGKSSCNGDSGGPLVLAEDGTQVGLVSFGTTLGCEIGWPAVHTRITSYLDWLEAKSDAKIE